jgi:Pyruvate/2-oxoacid:ferredoxin oxidoreductase gamma subunit
LNRLERPLDIGAVARAAGAPYVVRCSAYRNDLPDIIERAVAYRGFSVVDIWGICPGRFSKRNRLTPKLIDEMLARLPAMEGEAIENRRPEYGESYRQVAAGLNPIPPPAAVVPRFTPVGSNREEVILLGSAGQRIITAGELLCLAGLHAGLNTTQKNDYDITVLRGPSISELVLSPEPIDFSGIARPTLAVALGPEGVARRRNAFERLAANSVVIQAAGVEVPPGPARTHRVDFKAQGIKPPDWALASLGVLAKLGLVIRPEMLGAALESRLSGKSLSAALELVGRVEPGRWVED